MDVFFVVSGFLITSHLLSALARDGRIRFAEFYARRARRILPASLVVLVASMVAAVVWAPPLLVAEVGRCAVATALYIPNYFFALKGTNYLSETTPSLFQHYWSLGIEEQFYIFWPAVLALGWALAKSRRVFLALLVTLVVLSFVAGTVLIFVSQPWAFFSLPTRAWELGVGAIVAVLLSRRPSVLPASTAAVVGWAGVIGIIASAVLFSTETPFPGWLASVPVVATALVIIAGAISSRFGPAAALSLRGMQFLGRISYSLYLVHWPMLIVPQAARGFGNQLPLRVTLVLAALCVPLAWLVYRVVERPGQNAAWLVTARPRRSLLAAAASSLVAVLVATGTLLYLNTTRLSTTVDAGPTRIMSPPIATTFVPADLAPSLRAASTDLSSVHADGCFRGLLSTDTRGCLYGGSDVPRVAIFGDSHAAQWFPAIHQYAVANKLAVEVFTKGFCPPITANLVHDGIPYTGCRTWRDGVIERLNAERPALVILAYYGAVNFADQSRQDDSAWQEAMAATLDRLHVPTAIIADTPDMRETPSICLSAHLEDTLACSKARSVALDSPARAAVFAAAATYHVPVVDMNDYLCGPTTCPAVIGNILAYRDGHHLTATFSASLSAALGKRLRALI